MQTFLEGFHQTFKKSSPPWGFLDDIFPNNPFFGDEILNHALGKDSGLPSNPKICYFRICPKEARDKKILLLNLADSKAPINSNLGSVKVFKGASLFLEAINGVRISLLDDVTWR
ncbi:hypothetical protein TNIN_89651 [Trichonephila inaurata madagascariensis]|uniref:Uncharacterized protein n=1 Tax=Trichonephila inaurata madagascariensis TaxID=2747483 RepID=A0A8X6X6S7_9ARAC|nr:hypothetical protein TNIN_68701 [Trichonephila inaurata madagascariensis]GFY76797.1 hypothetical protein TNIN_89651 [Trichonephila inaurata madagascariensis]